MIIIRGVFFILKCISCRPLPVPRQKGLSLRDLRNSKESKIKTLWDNRSLCADVFKLFRFVLLDVTSGRHRKLFKKSFFMYLKFFA